MNDKPEAHLKWHADPKTIRTFAFLFEGENTSSASPFFQDNALFEKLSAIGMQVGRPSCFARMFKKRLFRDNDAVVRVRYVQKQSTVGYRPSTSTPNGSAGWITKENITTSSLQGSSLTYAIEASVEFSVETSTGTLVEGGAENRTFPEVLPSWLSATEVHHRAMQEGENLLLGAIDLLSECPGAPALKLLVRYGQHQDLTLARLSQLGVSSESLISFLSASPDDVLKHYWAFWPDGIRDSRAEVREEILRIVKTTPAKDMLECGSVALWGNYRLADLAKRNPGITSTLKEVALLDNPSIALRALSILALNGEPTAEDHLLKIARSPDWRLKSMAVWNTVRFGTEKLLRNAAGHQDPGVRRLFWTALAEFQTVFDQVDAAELSDDPAAQDVYMLLQGPACSLSKDRATLFSELAVRTLENDTSDAVRQAAVKAFSILCEFDVPVPDVIITLLSRLRSTDPNEGVRRESAVLLDRFSRETEGQAQQ